MYFNITSLFGYKENINHEQFINQTSPNENELDNKIFSLMNKFNYFISNRASLIIIDFVVANYELSILNSVIILICHRICSICF